MITTLDDDELLRRFYQDGTHRVEQAARVNALRSVEVMDSEPLPRQFHEARGSFLQPVNYMSNGPWKTLTG